MSEENNLSSSIYTTEDEFEKFQAGAKIEEDEFITLSDIVPPQPELPDLRNEIPFDNEVGLTSNDDTPLNSNNKSMQHQNYEQHFGQSINKDSHESFGEPNKNQQKGRKETKSIQNPKTRSNSSHFEVENNSFVDNQAVQDNVLSTTVDKNGIQSSNGLQEESKYPRRTRRERVPNTSKYPLISRSTLNNTPPSQSASGKRRGRPKKSTLENLTISEPDSTNIDTPALANADSSFTENSEPVPSNQTTEKKRRRGRPKASQAGLEQINPNNSSNNICESADLPLVDLNPTRSGRKKVDKIIVKQSDTNETSQVVNENVDVEIGISKLENDTMSLSEAVNLNKNTEKSPIELDDMDNDDDGDNICLSKLKKNINNITENLNDIVTSAENMQEKIKPIDKRDPKAYHIDTISQEAIFNESNFNSKSDESLLVEDTSKRPNRRKVKQNFKYDSDSEEDPFANVEISDDDEPISRKKGKYADDDEYIPGGKKGRNSTISSSDSELNEDEDEDGEDLKKLKKRRTKTKVFDSQSPNKRGKKRKQEPDLELCEEPSLAKSDDEPLSMKPPAEAWATSNEFENFIAQKIQNSSSLKIKKVSAKQKSDSNVTPLEIPVLNQIAPKKSIETASQTTKISTTSTGVQTSVPYDIPMKVNVNLSPEQSEKACAFLSSVVKTTVELGTLMKEKSEDFMKKKMNTDNVTDTFKMDYCVRKSFLLFKLAKHNLIQMEADLSQRYDEFLATNNLSSCREKPKNISPKPKVDSDSDCEIVDVKEVPSTSGKNEKPKLNKTVFLNKELSIKITKKPSAEKNVDVKGRHTIWINDSVMVKKVKPTQSFLAQDSRNKKPPDHITEKMVSDFFENYYLQRAVAVCAPFINIEWSDVRREYACYYFVKCNDFDESGLKNSEISHNMIEMNPSTSNGNFSDSAEILDTPKNSPKSLAFLCTEVVRGCMYVHNVKEANEDLTCDLTDGKSRSGPLSLFRLCYQSLQSEQKDNNSSKTFIHNRIEKEIKLLTVPPLKSLCCKRIVELMSLYEELKEDSKNINENTYHDVPFDANSSCKDLDQCDDVEWDSQQCNPSVLKKKNVESLISLCVNSIQTIFRETNTSCIEDSKSFYSISQGAYSDLMTKSPRPLKVIAYENIKHFMFGDKPTNCFIEDPVCQTEEVFPSHDNTEDFSINCVNTMSEEAFHGLEADDEFREEDDYDYEPDTEDFGEDNGEEGNEWASQVQMQVLRSCVTPANNLSDDDCGDMSIAHAITEQVNQNSPHSSFDNINISSRIKLEPQDDVAESIVDSSIVKIEPVYGLDGMTIIPESIVTKSEIMEQEHNTMIEGNESAERDSTGFDVSTFGQFLNKNKLIRPMDEDSDDEELFGQSGIRERREHEPDYDVENDINESFLLVPQTYEPLHIDNAKGVLMESSSDEGRDGTKKQSKKRTEKKRAKPKKVKEIAKNSNAKENPTTIKELPIPVKNKTPSNEVAVLTRRMREKIRQEEKKIESSDSETENIALSLRKDKDKVKENEKIKITKNSKQGESSSNKNVENEIQCNNVDSTDQTLENGTKSKDTLAEFTGFSAIDQNEISSYQKYMQFVYDKIVPADDESQRDVVKTDQDSNRPSSPLIKPDQPVELLECEPSMPIFDDENTPQVEKQPKKAISKKKENKLEKVKPNMSKFNERDGWHLYTIDTTDVKLYQKCHIPLEKLPESFVDTYLEYHDITNRDNIDKEVDRLANLQSLNRATSIKEGKSRSRQKVKSATPSEQNSETVSRAASPAYSDRFDELTPSEDEGAHVDDELPPPVPVRTTENNIAKNSLMDENESDSDGGLKKIKEEAKDSNEVEEPQYRPGPKSKTKMSKAKVDALPSSESLMLTADKMMNKELTLLHAPTVMKEEAKEVTPKEPSPKDETKSKKRSLRNTTMRDRLRTEDDSSSEEEKQWVSTKEKLLKRIVGKKEDATADDAKRAKLVDDFIERRGEGPETRRATARTSRRSRKKMLERLKQQRVLSNELLGEPSIDLTPGGKRSANVGLFKGRRNIRKVIDKKSLQKSTVLANMEEFERKRRLNSKLNQLRELLGCEEGVNVLVINDEVCLEYDFQEQRPVVTVHPFFTKVMKAHQYEGVKFMWDACFESLASLEAGHGGGGCILAHCMGLGKTLQVLALLHTVLTHPRAGMHRVLVCCPLSTVLNWVDEIHKWIGPVTDKIKVFELSKLKKTYERAYQLEDWYSGGGIFIIGYELFRSLTTLDPVIDEVRPTIINKIRTALLDPGPDIIICDEGHLLKNDCSVLAVAMSRVVTRRRIILTGTPMQNNLREYYCMVNFVKPNLLGTYSEYSNRFENPIMNGQHRDSREEDIKLMKARTHILHKVLEGCLQRQEASVLYPYLPKKHEYTVFIPLTKCQWDLYKHYVHHYTKDSKQSVLRDFHILQKIWSHPQVLHNFSTRDKRKEIKPEKLEDDLALEDKEDIKPPATETWWLQYLADGAMLDSIDSSNKFVAVFRILDECITLGDKVLIFSTSLDCLDALEYFLRQINGWNLGQEYYRLDGSVPAEVRQKWVREYNAENNHKTKLFLISTRAGCLGLNMTAANRVIILDTSWNPAHDIQSIFRVYRFGQKKDCYIYRLVAMGTMEQKIYERSVTKQAVACRVVDEQQIDRHYNMAELTELYKFDEHGVGVAGGVAVGVGDVVLLRVARDAAIHAVHEHDSLLRGSGEQGLPEHERAAAWNQFQQEHATKQMQNDMETDLADRALKALQEQQRLQLEQQQEIERQQAQALGVKAEDGPGHDLLVPMANQPTARGRGWPCGRGRGRANIVQCRIPISSDEPGPSRAPPAMEDDEAMVQQISNLLIKYNYSENQNGHQLKELVAKVKRMTQLGQVSFEDSDELTASIARVLMQHQNKGKAASPAPTPAPAPAPSPPMPALTNIEIEPRRRGRSRKAPQNLQSESPHAPHAPAPPKPPSKPVEPEESTETGGRQRRKAALVAELQFDLSDDGASQESVLPDPVIDLDDDDWQAAPSDTDSAPECTTLVAKETKPKANDGNKKLPIHPASKQPEECSSILLSDDESSSPPPVSKPSVKENETVAPVTPLHPSLLSNQNFIKIVAHTYLAGNPMMDEDAATLAAQYSTFKLQKETESSGKPITSGPIYDIAFKVLGAPVLKKLHMQTLGSKSKDSGESNAVSSKMAQFLDQGSVTEHSPAPIKKKPGPKSRVKAIKEESSEKTKTTTPTSSNQQKPPGIVPISLLRRVPGSGERAPTPAPAAQPAECILPDDDDDVRCVSDPPPPPTKPVSFKVRLPPLRKNQAKPQPTPEAPKDSIRVTSSGTPASASSSKELATICLDSDDEEPAAAAPAAPAPGPRRSTRALPAQYSAAGGPVPVAITGPAPQPVPRLAPAPSPPPRQPALAPASLLIYPSADRYHSEPVPVSLTGPNSRPVPISLTGPDNRPVPISLSGPCFQAISMGAPGPQAASASYTVPPGSFVGSNNVPTSFAGMTQTVSYASGATSIPMTFAVSSPAAGAGAGAARACVPGGVYLVPRAAAGERLLTRVPASQVPPHVQPAPLPATSLPAPASSITKTYCKPGDILRLTPSGKLQLVKLTPAENRDVVHTIDDDETIVPAPKATTPRAMATKTPTPASKPQLVALAPRVQAESTSSPSSTARSDGKERRKRKVSSSSSSSDSSRCATPDPLSIFRDVVHIQAPTKTKSNAPTFSKTDTSNRPSTNQTKPTPGQTKSISKPSSTPQIVKSKYKEEINPKKLTDVLNAVKIKKLEMSGAGKSMNTKDLIDLTEISSTPVKAGETKKNMIKGGKPMSTNKKDIPSTVVGTSKSIVLDGKSKSLTKKDSVNRTKMPIQVTSVKSIPSGSATKSKPLEKKRPAAPAETTIFKKKKTEPMTLKDFDIDDIDDIIELD